MIISPPFLPVVGLTSNDPAKPDPMMDAVDQFEIGHHGVYPVAFDRHFHCGIHLSAGTHGSGQAEPVRAIADGDVVAYRVSKNAISDGAKDPQGQPMLNSNTGFVLLKHTTETGDGRAITYYSLYMHLLDMTSQEHIVPQSDHPPETGSANELPGWLLDTANGKDGVVQLGGMKKVYRKDILGYVGQHQGVAHLHFEIFMTDDDSTAWFHQVDHQVQLGEKNPVQPTSSDHWGHTYFVIHGPQTFMAQPAGMSATWFPPLPGGSIGGQDTLYVEAWFNEGHRYTRAWIDLGNTGNVTLLTPDPIADLYDSGTDSHHHPKRYEYDLYQRAKTLYSVCPNDGYEMLRFGRILSHPIAAGAAPATWVAVPFDENGKQGYIDIAPDAIIKLSDADFPFFKDWQKVDEDNTPFDHNGLCGYDELCRLTGVADPQATSGMIEPLEYDKNNDNAANQQFAGYVQNAKGMRDKLRGLVCKAYSEWDPCGNTRYDGLNDPDGFFGKQKDTNPTGYATFIEFLSKFQFLDKTSLSGQKLWYFHPLAFIRHFRKCGWLSAKELARCLPRSSASVSLPWELAQERALTHCRFISRVNLKYLNSRPLRLLHFLAQTYIETGGLRTMTEDSLGHGHAYGPFYGRGYLQLTWPKNYEAYKNYQPIADHGFSPYTDPRITSTSMHPWADGDDAKRWAPRYDPEVIAGDLVHAAESSGMYWLAKTFRGTYNINRAADLGASPALVGFISWLINGGGNGYADRQQFAVLLDHVLLDRVGYVSNEILRYPPLSPPSHPTLCVTFPPATIPFSQSVTINYVPQVP